MNLKSFKQKLEERNQKIREFNQALQKEGKEFIVALFQPLFKKYAAMESFAWAQCEHYNDQTDVFSVESYPEAIWINGEQLNDLDEDDESYAWRETAADEISKVLGELNEDDYEMLFGNGSKITVSKTELITEDYYV